MQREIWGKTAEIVQEQKDIEKGYEILSSGHGSHSNMISHQLKVLGQCLHKTMSAHLQSWMTEGLIDPSFTELPAKVDPGGGTVMSSVVSSG